MKTIITAIAAMTAMMIVPLAHAAPMNGIVASAGNYSVIHDGANPGGQGNPSEWGWFEPEQQIDLQLNDGILTLSSPQSFSLFFSATESLGLVTFLEMELDLNDEDGFAGGFLSYTMGQTEGLFVFADLNYNNIFNSSSQTGNVLDIFVWGGDPNNQRGIDLGLSLIVVPEPATVALMLLGLAGMTLLIGRRETLAVVKRNTTLG